MTEKRGEWTWRAVGTFGIFTALLTGCGGENMGSAADESKLSIAGAATGSSQFIQVVEFTGARFDQITSVNFTIRPLSGSTSRPVNVTYEKSNLTRRGYVSDNAKTMKIPVFGLYANSTNNVDFEIRFSDGSKATFTKELSTPAYIDPAGIYDQLKVLKARAPVDILGYDYFAIQSGPPVIYDTDGRIRWVGVPPVINAAHSVFTDGGFLIGGSDGDASMMVTRLELDGTSSGSLMIAPPYTAFHHNLDFGKLGYLGEFDAQINGINYVETILSDISPDGRVLTEFDFGKIIADFMTKNGDDAAQFVRPGVDWFHMNAALYDSRDDSVIASSRENFLIKVDYKTKAIIWIFGDPTKYWYTFPSLRSKALRLAAGGLYPVGQHGISISPDKKLLLFNNGFQSMNQPAGAPTGENRTYSAVVAYDIDETQKTANENWRFDYGQSIYSDICSNPQQANDGSIFINYASASNRTKVRLVGLNPQHQVVYDFELPTTLCQTSYHGVIVPLESLTLK